MKWRKSAVQTHLTDWRRISAFRAKARPTKRPGALPALPSRCPLVVVAAQRFEDGAGFFRGHPPVDDADVHDVLVRGLIGTSRKDAVEAEARPRRRPASGLAQSVDVDRARSCSVRSEPATTGVAPFATIAECVPKTAEPAWIASSTMAARAPVKASLKGARHVAADLVQGLCEGFVVAGVVRAARRGRRRRVC